jgi:hypothetical protein
MESLNRNPDIPSKAAPTEQLIAHWRPLLRDKDTATLALLVAQYGYRTASRISGRSRGALWAQLRPEQAKIPRGRKTVRIIEVRWAGNCTQALVPTGEPAIISRLRLNLGTFLTRAERLGGLSTMQNRKAKTMAAHLGRINKALARLAIIHLHHAERATQRVPWATLLPEDVERVFLSLANLQERIVQILAVMLLWRNPKAYREIRPIYQTNSSTIRICPQTLEIPTPQLTQKMTYNEIAAVSHTTREKIKIVETKALQKLRRLLEPEWDDLSGYLS